MEWDPLLFLVIFFVGVVLVTMCVLFTLLLAPKRQPAPTPVIVQSAVPQVAAPPVAPPSTFPHFFPFIAGGAPAVPDVVEYIYRVTKIDELGYEAGGQRHDMATFMRTDTMEIVQGYCIDPGLAVPSVGTEYRRTAGDIMLPLVQPPTDPLQRFQIIQ